MADAADRVSDLLLGWADQLARGEAVEAINLCRDTPDLAMAVWLENGERGTGGKDRGAPEAQVVEASADPELQVRGLLRRRRGLFPYSRAVCFGNRGKN